MKKKLILSSLEQGHKIYKIPINEIRANLNNPRTIEDAKFKELVQSIKNDGFMQAIRFLVVDKDNVVLGGNQRLQACIEANMSHVFVVKADDLSEDELKEFVIQDNTYYGEWDKPILAEFYSDHEMVEVGMNLVEVATPRMEMIGDIEAEVDESDLEKRKEVYENNKIKQIVCYFTLDKYEQVKNSLEIIKKRMECQELNEVLLNLITYWKQEYVHRNDSDLSHSEDPYRPSYSQSDEP